MPEQCDTCGEPIEDYEIEMAADPIDPHGHYDYDDDEEGDG